MSNRRIRDQYLYKKNHEVARFIHFHSLSRIICLCGSCGKEKKTLSVWELHTGSRSKKWKVSVKVKSSLMPLGKWVSIFIFSFLLDIISSMRSCGHLSPFTDASKCICYFFLPFIIFSLLLK